MGPLLIIFRHKEWKIFDWAMEVHLLYKMSSFVGQHHAITYDIVTKLKSLFVYYVIILTGVMNCFSFLISEK